MPQASSLKPKILRIAILGPESTGKSALAKQLASYFKTVWMPEYSREYLSKLGRKYNYDDILAIARGQWASEVKLLTEAERMIIADTEFIVNKIWCDDKFGKCHQWILEMINRHPYDLYLLCGTDLTWAPDPLRENPHDRDRLLEIYKHELESRKLPFVLISGTGSERLKMAIEAITQHSKPKT